MDELINAFKNKFTQLKKLVMSANTENDLIGQDFNNVFSEVTKIYESLELSGMLLEKDNNLTLFRKVIDDLEVLQSLVKGSKSSLDVSLYNIKSQMSKINLV